MKTKINHKVVSSGYRVLHARRLGLYLAFIFGLLLFVALPSSSAETNFSESFSTKEEIASGSLVSIKSGTDNEVVLSAYSNSDGLIGVATKGTESLLAANFDSSKVQVATSGEVTAFVSDINGKIKSGDLIAVSPISGVGAKAQSGNRVVGLAKEDFNNERASKQTIIDKNGKSSEVLVSKMVVLVSVGSYIDNLSNKTSTVSLWATKLFGKPVSIARLALCGFIAVIALISLGVIIYSSIHSSIAAIGRNPLARPVIFESLAQAMSMVALVSVIAVASIYFVVRI
jgi:hypothetical protein